MPSLTDTVQRLESQLIRAESKLHFFEEQKVAFQKQLEDVCEEISKLESDNDIFLKASTLLQLVSEKTREHSIQKIEAIISQALQEVYGNRNLKFKILFQNKRNTTVVDFTVWDGELNRELDINKGEAGGIKAIISTILRLIVIDLYHPKISGPVALDEVGVQISVEYQERFGAFLRQYSELTGRQIILISHQDKVSNSAHQKIRLKRSSGNIDITYEKEND